MVTRGNSRSSVETEAVAKLSVNTRMRGSVNFKHGAKKT